MAVIARQLARLCKHWSQPRTARHGGHVVPFRLACAYTPSSSVLHDDKLPPALTEFWNLAESARLFEDREFGQWGLELLTIDRSNELTRSYQHRRQADARPGDRIIGRFFGDSDELLVRCAKRAPDYGSIIVVLPIDQRGDWYHAAPSLDEFLERYFTAQGAKFWEA